MYTWIFTRAEWWKYECIESLYAGLLEITWALDRKTQTGGECGVACKSSTSACERIVGISVVLPVGPNSTGCVQCTGQACEWKTGSGLFGIGTSESREVFLPRIRSRFEFLVRSSMLAHLLITNRNDAGDLCSAILRVKLLHPERPRVVLFVAGACGF